VIHRVRDALVQLLLDGLSAGGFSLKNVRQIETICRNAGEMPVRKLPAHARSEFWPMVWSKIRWTLVPLYVVVPLVAVAAIYVAA
jgi:hypothetical protein